MTLYELLMLLAISCQSHPSMPLVNTQGAQEYQSACQRAKTLCAINQYNDLSQRMKGKVQVMGMQIIYLDCINKKD